MKNLSPLVALTALLAPTAAWAFAPPSGDHSVKARTVCAASRRDFLSNAVATTFTITTTGVVLTPLPSFADLSDGNALPQGAAQFSRVIKVRAQLQVRLGK